MQVAQTNLQLFNQLREADSPLEDLLLVHRGYELLTTLYTGVYQTDGKPFVAHGVGVASILGALDQPIEVVAAGMLHNVYGNTDFGDGRAPGALPSRRRIVREAMGERIEALLVRFVELRSELGAIESRTDELPALDDADRPLYLMELADRLEKYSDLGILYFGRNEWVPEATDRGAQRLVEVAEALGEPRLARMLADALAAVAAETGKVPPELRTSDGRNRSKLVVPRSCRTRAVVRLRRAVRPVGLRLRNRLRLRTRVRGLRASVVRQAG